MLVPRYIVDPKRPCEATRRAALSVDQVIDMTGVGRRTAYGWISRRQVQVYREGAKVWVFLDSLPKRAWKKVRAGVADGVEVFRKEERHRG